MGPIILCETKEASNSYTFSAFHQEISTYEEMCYYIKEYFIFFVEEGIPDDLLRFVINDLGIRDIETDWKLLNNDKDRLKRLFSCRNYFLPQEVANLMKKYDRHMTLDAATRKSRLGDEYLKQKRYETALKCYKQTNVFQNDARVCYNIGVCYAHLGDLDRAAHYFMQSYKIGGKKKAQYAYFGILMLQGEFTAVKITAGTDYPAFKQEWDAMKEAFAKMSGNDSAYQKKNRIEEMKEQYRREVDEWI
ncbi:MAG: tetratricopeptide repeat protein [Lachnospiraceae bacterium]|nr:tetratricopeptide repeat protein [Lachnospiraceae bacterium]